jgi:hypothetical protein
MPFGGSELGSGERSKYFEVGSSARTGEVKTRAKAKDKTDNAVLFMRDLTIL